MRIVLIGTGNTATVLGRLMKHSNHELIQIYGRRASVAKDLAEQLGAAYCSDMRELDNGADIYIIAISDSAIAEIGNQLKLNNKLVVHTAGSVSKELLKNVSRNYGVLYPLQSLHKEMKGFPVIPFLVDGNTSDDLTLIYDFAQSISELVEIANDEERMRYHLAAVLLNNFSNHLYTLVQDYCKMTYTDFRFLMPLVQHLPERLTNHSSRELQTGPAVRKDQVTINKHLDLLSDHPQIKNLYTLFTESIQEYYYKSK